MEYRRPRTLSPEPNAERGRGRQLARVIFQVGLHRAGDFAPSRGPLTGAVRPGLSAVGSSYGGGMSDEITSRYGDMLAGVYDCVDRIVLNAYFSLGHNPGGFRVWWRRLHGDSDDELDNTHLMRMAGRFARRVRGWAAANGVPVIDCKSGERKHEIAEQYLSEHPGLGRGVFMVLVARAPASTWDVQRSKTVIKNLARKQTFINHYSFHILDPDWGHLTIKMSGHPPFPAQVMLNGHEHVACRARAAGVSFLKEGNCFTTVADPDGLARIADTLSHPATAGRLGQAIDRWIYTACLCFGLDIADQQATLFRYSYSIYQIEYSRNLLFRSGRQMERVFDAIVDRTRSRLDIPRLRTMFGSKQRPRTHGGLSPRVAAVIETPSYDLTIFKLHFGALTLKGYTKGEHVLRFEAVCHNTRYLNVGRILDRFGDIVERLTRMLDEFCTTIDCVDVTFIPDGILDELHQPTTTGRTRVGGVDLNKTRARTTLRAVVALAAKPDGFTVADLTNKVHAITGDNSYTIRQAAYDLRKLRGHSLIDKPGRGRRYHVPVDATRTICALLVLRQQVIAPIVAGLRRPNRGRKPAHWTAIDRDYETLRTDMNTLFNHLAITTHAA